MKVSNLGLSVRLSLGAGWVGEQVPVGGDAGIGGHFVGNMCVRPGRPPRLLLFFELAYISLAELKLVTLYGNFHFMYHKWLQLACVPA